MPTRSTRSRTRRASSICAAACLAGNSLFPAESRDAIERRHASGDHRNEADVQRVRGQRGGDRHVQVGESAAAARHPSERRHESALPGHDVDQVREIDPREHPVCRDESG